MYSYAEEFRKAILFTKELGFRTPDFVFRDKLYCDQEAINKISKLLEQELVTNKMRIEDLTAQCLNMNIRIVKKLSNILRCKAIVTIGYITIKSANEDLYRFSREELRNWLNPNSMVNQANAHAWITLESGEVVELTLLTSIAVIKGCEGKGAFMCARPEDPGMAIEFHPIAVGIEVIEKAFSIN
jgi:hypothetical protein